MKLLLTSAGITNQSIADALLMLAGKPIAEVKVCIVPTAANVEQGDKDWFLNQFTTLQRYGIGWIDMVDPSANGVDWQSRLSEADVIFVSGGNTFHLLNQTRQTGFDTWLAANLADKVYVGVSAGTILVTPRIDVAAIAPADPNDANVTDFTGLNLVPFEVEPHCEGERFTVLERYAKEQGREVYAIDDSSALQVVDGEVTVISEGDWKHFGSNA